MLIAVVVTSVAIVRRRLRYETWYAVHFAAYVRAERQKARKVMTGKLA